MNPLDDPFYYLNNFHRVLDWIEGRYPDLLEPEEKAFIDEFRGLPKRSQGLLVRMVMRKGTLFRENRLAYEEIGSIREAAKSLVKLGGVNPTPSLNLEELFGLLTRQEIVGIFRHRLPRPQARKTELLEQLAAENTEPRTFNEWWPGRDEQVFALDCMPLCDRFRLMFFGNLHQDWSEFVLADLGVHRYEKVAFDPGARAFRNRHDLDQYLRLHRCRERLEADEPVTDIVADLPCTALDNSWLESRRQKLLFRLAQRSERSGDLETALGLYADNPYPGARTRHIRVLERLGEAQEALALAEVVLAKPENEAERQQVERMRPRLRRKLGLPAPSRRVTESLTEIELRLPPPDCPQPVERVALIQLQEPEAPVHYVENTLINGLFGLLCWDAVFADVTGAFFHPFQTGPADLLQPDFHERRADLFRDHLKLLDSGAYRHRIMENFRAKYGIQSPFVYWEALSEDLLDQALSCFPPAHLKAWFQRLLDDIGGNRAGLPDLVQFWPDERRYRMIEVKGPGDRLQDNQKRWLSFCAARGMPVAVCYVRWQGPTP